MDNLEQHFQQSKQVWMQSGWGWGEKRSTRWSNRIVLPRNGFILYAVLGMSGWIKERYLLDSIYNNTMYSVNSVKPPWVEVANERKGFFQAELFLFSFNAMGWGNWIRQITLNRIEREWVKRNGVRRSRVGTRTYFLFLQKIQALSKCCELGQKKRSIDTRGEQIPKNRNCGPRFLQLNWFKRHPMNRKVSVVMIKLAYPHVRLRLSSSKRSQVINILIIQRQS